MISQISGIIISVGENSIILKVGDIAYEILVPTSVITHCRKKSSRPVEGDGPPDTFYTIQYIEGSSGHGNQFMRLVGFRREIEKEFFQIYTSVEGIGYKKALKSLTLPIQKIALSIENSDIATLKKLPHIGSRTAEKMVATLRGRMQKFALDLEDQPLTATEEAFGDSRLEVLQVLRQIGYTEQESLRLIEKALQNNPKIKTSEEMIQEIFKMQSIAP